jgi:hypothetical protein
MRTNRAFCETELLKKVLEGTEQGVIERVKEGKEA